MTKTLNLTGFKTGDNLNLSVSQGALTAGPVNVPSWGGGEGGGTISIKTHRTNLQCAPDSVRFRVDLSEATFDTRGPGTDGVYDPRLHDLIFLWDFDDVESGDWTAPVNVLPEWKNRNVAKGPFVAHMFNTPRPKSGGDGTGYNVSVMVLEPSSGKVANASIEVFVEDPDVIYGASGTYPDTICVNPVGDNDFSDKPDGAQEVNADLMVQSDQWYLNQRSDQRPKRYLFKRGASYRMKMDFNSSHGGIYIGSYGNSDSPKPIINAVDTMDGTRGLGYGHGGFAGNEMYDVPAPDFRLSELDFRGTLNPATRWPVAGADGNLFTTGFFFARVLDVIISNCDASGLVSWLYMAPGGTQDQKSRQLGHLHMDNCTMTDFGGTYPIFVGGIEPHDSSVAFTGCRFSQRADAVDTDLTDEEITEIGGRLKVGTRAVMRCEWVWNSHMRGCDIYFTDSTQPAMKFVSASYGEGATVNLHSSSIEGGGLGMTISGEAQMGTLGRSTLDNVIVDGLIYVAAWAGSSMFTLGSTGVTIRNCLGIWPSIQRHWDVPATLIGFVEMNSRGTEYNEHVANGPIRVYNNTFVTERTQSQNIEIDPIILRNQAYFANLVETNNIVHKPNKNTPSTIYAPLASDILWTARNVGRRSPRDFSLQVTQVVENDLLTPADAVRSYRPAIKSPALGAALSGEVSYMDITLRTRPEPPSKGAWEME